MSIPFLVAGRGDSQDFFSGATTDASSLAAEVERALRATGSPPLRRLKVVAHDGVVSLFGIVPSYYIKQLAQATAMTVRSVHKIHNELDVISSR